VKKVHIEEIDKMMNPGDRICSRAHWEKNGPMLLDALINANQALELAVEHGTHFLKSGFCTETFGIMQESIEAASFVEVEE